LGGGVGGRERRQNGREKEQSGRKRKGKPPLTQKPRRKMITAEGVA